MFFAEKGGSVQISLNIARFAHMIEVAVTNLLQLEIR